MSFNTPTDRDIDRLFEGSLDGAGDLAPVAALFETLRMEVRVDIDEQTVTRFVAATSAASTTAARERSAATRTARVVSDAGVAHGSLTGSLRHRAAAIAVSVAVFAGGMTGMAVAADHAKPGDALYGLDRAFEVVGIGNGRAAERLVESRALVDAGNVARGLRHATEAVEITEEIEITGGAETIEGDHAAASFALREAADRVGIEGSDRSVETRTQVAGLLTYLSASASGVDGRRVAELAREIGRPDDHPGASDDRPGEHPAGPPSANPGSPPGYSANPPGHSGTKPAPKIPPKDKP